MAHLLWQFPHHHHWECDAQFHKYWRKVFITLKKRLGTKLLWKYFLDSWREMMTYMRQGSIGREEGRKRQKPCIKIHFDHGQRTAIYHGWFIVFFGSVRSSGHIHIAMLREQKSNKRTIKQIRQINAVITTWRSIPNLATQVSRHLCFESHVQDVNCYDLYHLWMNSTAAATSGFSAFCPWCTDNERRADFSIAS